MKRRNKKKWMIIALVVVAAGLIGGAVYLKSANSTQKRQEKTAQQNHAKNDTPADQVAKNTSTPTNTSAGKGAAVAAPTKPTLLKSSGNHGSVPAESNIRFVCQGAAGESCDITLKNSSGTVTRLGQKTLVADQTNTASVDWYWDAVSGSWTVTATASNTSGQSISSDAQSLEVQ